MKLEQKLSAAVRDGDAMELTALLNAHLREEGTVQPFQLLRDGLLPGAEQAEAAFRRDEIFVPEILLSRAALKAGIHLLEPYFPPPNPAQSGICIGTVAGDLHSAGKELVCLMFQARGLSVRDLGVDVPTEEFVRLAREENCHLLCCSISLTEGRKAVRRLVSRLEAESLRDKTAVLIGGGAVSLADCEKLGADGYASSAAQAAELGEQFLKTGHF